MNDDEWKTKWELVIALLVVIYIMALCMNS
jgi:hypothetical protein